MGPDTAVSHSLLRLSSSYSLLFCCAVLFFSMQSFHFQVTFAQDVGASCSDCNGEPENFVCASDGRSYNNTCEMNRRACQTGDNLVVDHEGKCITREILKSELCSSHSERILSMQYNTHPNSSSWSKMCNNTELLEKANAGNLSIVDVINCYRPRCESSDEYKTLQCYNLSQQSRWCWCSGPTGLYIEDTFTQGQTDSLRATCSTRSSCNYSRGSVNETHNDGTLFLPESSCGICECLNGVVTCFDELVPDTKNELNATQVNLLRELMLKVYFFQYTHNQSRLINVKEIQRYLLDINDAVKLTIIDHKFESYDTNGDGSIARCNSEEEKFHSDIYQFTWCTKYLDHISSIIDADNNYSISHAEWKTFLLTDFTDSAILLNTSDCPVRRRRRSLKGRRKFYYTL